MSAANYDTALNIANRAAVEVGLIPLDSGLYSASNHAFVQLRNLLKSVGQELVGEFPWERITKEWTFTTNSSTDTGDYDLPEDWSYMVPQTGWDRTNAVPVGNPLSAQTWQYLEGRGLAASTIYVRFRLREGQLSLYPQPPPDGVEFAVEYVSRDWVLDADGSTPKDAPSDDDDVILLPDILVIKALKAKFLAAKGFDTTKADAEFERQMHVWTGKDNSAPVLNAGRRRRTQPYIHPVYNTPDTDFG